MLKAMYLGCFYFVVLAAVSANASPFSLRNYNDEVPEDCKNAVLACLLPAILPYIGLNETQIVEKIRDTPLKEHCIVATTAGDCVQKEFHGDSCTELGEGPRREIAMLLELHDFSNNYICQEHFAKIDRNFRCIVQPSIARSIDSTCSTPISDSEDICLNIATYIDCTSGVVEAECGDEAADFNRDFGTKFLHKVIAATQNVDCSDSKRANRFAFIRRFLANF